jgi:hypothetical protein
MKPERAQQGPKKYNRTDQERAMEKIVEIEFCKKGREVPGAPEKRRCKQRAADEDSEKISEQFGGIFQGR